MAADRLVAQTGLDVDLRQLGPIPLAAKFACEAGELLALVGPSGGGKTTILRTIAGLCGVREGHINCGNEVWLNTQRRVSLRPQERRVGFVFQDYALFPHLSVRDNIAVAVSDSRERNAKVLSLLEQVNLSGLGERYPSSLSGGQQQRVAIARALARKPTVLLLDEPFSAVDQVTRRKLRQELAELRRSLVIPVILVTHDLEEAGMLADRMCIVHRGETLQTGPPFEVMARPLNVTIARLVDHVNLFQATVLEHDRQAERTIISWHGLALECRYQPQFAAGDQVAWVIPSSNIVLHRRDRPSRGERENPLQGKLVSYLPLGETATVTMSLAESTDEQLVFSVPTHVAERNRLAEGGAVAVSLLSEAITLMPSA